MALFWRLVLAHVAADFALQTDAVFRVKKRFSWGVLLHGAIFALTSILALSPYLGSFSLWVGLIFLWLFHVAVDKAVDGWYSLVLPVRPRQGRYLSFHDHAACRKFGKTRP